MVVAFKKIQIWFVCYMIPYMITFSLHLCLTFYFLWMLTDAFMRIRRHRPLSGSLEGAERESTRSLSFCLCLKCALPHMCPRADPHNQAFLKEDSESVRVCSHTSFLSFVNIRSDSAPELPSTCWRILHTQRMNWMSQNFEISRNIRFYILSITF